MQKLHLEIEIDASAESVWDAIVSDAKYRQWTSAFQEGSYFEGGWNAGDKIRFIAINDKGEKEGMVSQIAESRYPSFISILHLGYLVNGIEDTTSEEVKKWAPSYENYTLESKGDQTVFKLDQDVNEEYYAMFLDIWPKALQKLKEISESGSKQNQPS
jgi:hypothetical protein